MSEHTSTPMQIHRTMLSQMRLVDDRYTACKPLPPPPTMSLPVPQQHNYGYAPPVLPPLRFAAMAAYHPPAPVLRPPPPPPMMRMTTPPVARMTPAFEPSAPLSPASPSTHKCSLSFILSSDASPNTTDDSDASSMQNKPRDRPCALKHKRRDPSTAAAAGSKSKYCTTEGCTSRAKHARKCWRHGGSVKCKVTDCINRAKSRGVCWSHGGGTMCSHSNCGTIAVSHGFCWAHGGGKRCQVGGCSRPAYERTENLCATHFKQHKATTAA